MSLMYHLVTIEFFLGTILMSLNAIFIWILLRTNANKGSDWQVIQQTKYKAKLQLVAL